MFKAASFFSWSNLHYYLFNSGIAALSNTLHKREQEITTTIDTAAISTIWLIALLSCTLGTTNALPIPCFDGAGMFYAILEWTVGKPRIDAAWLKYRMDQCFTVWVLIVVLPLALLFPLFSDVYHFYSVYVIGRTITKLTDYRVFV